MKGLEKQFHRKELVVTNANGWCAFFHLLHCYLQTETYREEEKLQFHVSKSGVCWELSQSARPPAAFLHSIASNYFCPDKLPQVFRPVSDLQLFFVFYYAPCMNAEALLRIADRRHCQNDKIK